MNLLLSKLRPVACRRRLPLSATVVAFALRVYRLDHHNIWGDEAFSIWLSKQPLSQVVAGGADTHPPFYPMLLYAWLRVAGDSPFAVRFLSVVPGVLLIASLYVLGRRLISQRAGLLAAILATVSPFAIYYSQETRMYAWAVILSALSIYAFVRVTDRHAASNTSSQTSNSELLPWYVLYVFATLSAAYTHYYAFFVVLAQNAFVVWHWRRLRRFHGRWFTTQVGIAMAYVPWVLVQISFLQGKAHARFETWGLPGMRTVWVRTLTAFGVGTTASSTAEWLALALLFAVGIGAVATVRHRLGRVAVLYLVIPLAGAWLVNPIMPFFYERYLIVALPAYLLLLAAGLTWLRHRYGVVSLLGIALLLAVSGHSLYNYYAVPAYAKGGYGELMAYVKAHAQPGDGLLLENPLQKAIYDYYAPQTMPAYWFPPDYPWDDPRTQAQLARLAEKHDRLWLVMFGNPAEYDPNHELERWLSTRGFRSYQGDYVDGSLALYTMAEDGATYVPANTTFANRIHLQSYAVNSDTVARDETLELTLIWEALERMDKDYTTFVHVIDEDEKIWAQMDSQPHGGAHPTSAWEPGERVVDRFGLQLDRDMPAGLYEIEVGWYYLPTLQRLPVTEAAGQTNGDRVLLGPVRITD